MNRRQGSPLQLSYIFFLIAICIIIMVSISSYINFKKLIRTGDWVEHTYQVMMTTLQISDAILYIESRQRGNLLFEDKDFNSEYQKIVTDINRYIEVLKAKVSDNPLQKERVNYLQSLIEKRLVILNELINLKKENNLNTLRAYATFTEGRLLSSQLRQNIAQFLTEENRLLKIRDDLVKNSVKHYNIFLLVGQGLSILFLIFAFLALMQSKRQISTIENQLWGVVNSAKDIIVAIDDKMRFLIFNQAFKDEFFKTFNKEIMPGMSLNEALASGLEQKDDASQKEKILEVWKESFAANKPYSRVIELTNNDGTEIYEIHSNKIYDEGKFLAAVHITRNITERVKEQAELERANQQLNQAMQELSDKNSKISLLLEMSDVMLATNSLKELADITTKYASQILNFTRGYVYVMHPSRNLLESSSMWGKPLSTTVQFTPEDCWALRLGKIHYASRKLDMTCTHVNAETFYLCVPLRAQNDIFGVLYIEFNNRDEVDVLSKNNKLIIGTFAEITALALANVSLRESLKYQSIRDPLTTLFNRRYLEEFLSKLISQSERNHQPISVLMLDIDHFKRINDIYGHDAGDLVLKEFSKILINEIRPGDVVARYGGEEFVIVFYHTKIENALIRANKIRKKIASLNLKYGVGHIGKITVSIGVSSYPKSGTNNKTLIEAADKALYIAKNSGRDRVVSFEDDKFLSPNIDPPNIDA